MKAGSIKLTIPIGSYTIAYYWKDRPYNLYIWRDNEGKYLGSYFNIVRNTYMADTLVSFEDLIIDILVTSGWGLLYFRRGRVTCAIRAI